MSNQTLRNQPLRHIAEESQDVGSLSDVTAYGDNDQSSSAGSGGGHSILSSTARRRRRIETAARPIETTPCHSSMPALSPADSTRSSTSSYPISSSTSTYPMRRESLKRRIDPPPMPGPSKLRRRSRELQSDEASETDDLSDEFQSLSGIVKSVIPGALMQRLMWPTAFFQFNQDCFFSGKVAAVIVQWHNGCINPAILCVKKRRHCEAIILDHIFTGGRRQNGNNSSNLPSDLNLMYVPVKIPDCQIGKAFKIEVLEIVRDIVNFHVNVGGPSDGSDADGSESDDAYDEEPIPEDLTERLNPYTCEADILIYNLISQDLAAVQRILQDRDVDTGYFPAVHGSSSDTGTT